MSFRKSSICALVLSLASAAIGESGESVLFEDVAAERGVRFVHSDYRTGEKFYTETTASGAGWLDFDADGDLDILLLQGAPPPGAAASVSSNLLLENRSGRFVDVTVGSGLGDTAFSMGMCIGDADGDDRLDVYVANYGPDRLYLNRGGGRFEDVAAENGIAGPPWSSSCAFGDVDADGDLDLYVSRYVNFDYQANPDCGDPATRRKFYCQPTAFDGVADSLFINDGKGHFEDQSRRRGVKTGRTEKGMGVLMSDLDDDGDLDIYVANDGEPNRVYANDGDGFFTDEGLLSGASVNAFGRSEASMGVDAGDLDGDGNLDLVVTHFAMETNTLYMARGPLDFDDRSQASGFGPPSLRLVSWGIQLLDADNDGDLDIALANGHIEDDLAIAEPGLEYEQAAMLLENLGGGRFDDISTSAGEVWGKPRVGRGLAAGDFNNDGRVDLLLTSTNGPAELLENRTVADHHWLGIVLEGPAGARAAIGARVRLEAGGRTQVREVRSGGSFQSQPDLRIHFGLGENDGPVEAEVRWPDGRVQVERTAEVDRYWTIRATPESSP